jgi:hypothetical protein
MCGHVLCGAPVFIQQQKAMSFPGKKATPGIEGHALRQARAVPSNVAGAIKL